MSLWSKHTILEKNSIILVIAILIVVAIGGLVEIVEGLTVPPPPTTGTDAGTTMRAARP